MPSSDNKTERLSQDIGDLNVLSRLRDEARSLRNDGIDALVNFSVKDRTWEQEISDNEKVLFRRAKHLAWNLGKIPVHECDHNDHLYFSRIRNGPSPGAHVSEPREYPAWPEISVPFFKVADFLDVPGLCRKLRDGKDPLSRYLRKRFAKRTRQLLNQDS